MLTNSSRWETSKHYTADLCLCRGDVHAPSGHLQGLQGWQWSQGCCPFRLDDPPLKVRVHSHKAVCRNGWKIGWIHQGKEAGKEWKAPAVAGLPVQPFIQLAFYALHVRPWGWGVMLPSTLHPFWCNLLMRCLLLHWRRATSRRY